MKEIVVATTNKGKVAEIALALANLPVKVLDLSDFGDIPEAVEDGDSFMANAQLKAKHYAHHTRKACLADDSGLEVDALGGAPGIYSARFAGEDANDAANNQKLLAELTGVVPEKRTARFRCVLALADIDGTIMTADGVREGIIGQDLRGLGGFGYDPLFYIPEMEKTMAECSKNEKNDISHRGQALKIMTKILGDYLK
ncbi:XTP/dITP diphosphatase [Pelosinus fermentans]|uniref:dITP/XTP pyrophosphatase n=1 Tax=Pelosinus fermentans JBW45 TaxID=1192197 RepID=I9DCB0_9FIRM|nr:XTP/dITP diphosphatase [Pelosinus fermentans]AJQ26856.1 Nucleoside-triphosphatase rdgB [Pelosinus fermentans JBW45]